MKVQVSDYKRLFIHWVEERESVRLSKEAGNPPPWSTDPIFHDTYFCNVRREDDKVTRGIRRLHLKPHLEKVDMAAWNLIFARMVNKVESLEAMDWPFGKGDIWQPSFNDVMSQKGSWGSAYIVSTNGNPLPKHSYIAGLLEQAFERVFGLGNANPQGTLAAAHRALMGVSGLGSFMAAQVVADLKNTRWHPLNKAGDFHSFSAPGPGSLRGLSKFHQQKITPKSYHQALLNARLYVQRQAPALVDGLCNQDLQNCFCEYDKYVRVLTGEGRSKRKYVWKSPH